MFGHPAAFYQGHFFPIHGRAFREFSKTAGVSICHLVRINNIGRVQQIQLRSESVNAMSSSLLLDDLEETSIVASAQRS